MIIRYIFPALLTGILLAACSHSDKTIDFETTYSDACIALADDNLPQSQELADKLRDLALGVDSNLVSDTQTARLSILYMKLSEMGSEEENIADATRLFLHAFRRSDDSLKSFYESLPLEDTPRYVLLRRLGLSLDKPVELDDSILLDIEEDR